MAMNVAQSEIGWEFFCEQCFRGTGLSVSDAVDDDHQYRVDGRGTDRVRTL